MKYEKNTTGIMSLHELLELKKDPPTNLKCPRCGGLLVRDAVLQVIDCSDCEKMFDFDGHLIDIIH